MEKIDRRGFIKAVGAFSLSAVSAQAAEKTAKRPPHKDGDREEKQVVLPFVPGSWTLVILPDTQLYSELYPGLFNLQTQWILENRDKYNIVYVVQNGDITNRNTPVQWERASRALRRLDAKVPYALVPGNHDYTPDGAAERDSTLINNYFPPSRFEAWPSFGGVMQAGRIENSYHRFRAGGHNWLILALEWGPRDKTLRWANEVLGRYADHHAIVVTHAYLYSDSTRYNWKAKGESQKWNPHAYPVGAAANDGQQMWEKLISRHENMFMTINGHVLNDGLGFLQSEAAGNKPVHQMLVNFQMLPVGGGAWLRLVEFLPDGKTIHVKNYSPLYEKYNTGSEDQFMIQYDLG